MDTAKLARQMEGARGKLRKLTKDQLVEVALFGALALFSPIENDGWVGDLDGFIQRAQQEKPRRRKKAPRK
jgi:hypothetical protein